MSPAASSSTSSSPAKTSTLNNGRVQVSGQVAVMMINGLLCKVIFDHNPTNEFYVEESFPLDWMYPYETPSGIIMKINRNPVHVLYPRHVTKKTTSSGANIPTALVGNWITYDTTVKEIADFAQKVYLGNNYAGFKGDRKFVRDDDAQKAFSKLRSSIAGMYAWRLGQSTPGRIPAQNRGGHEAAGAGNRFRLQTGLRLLPLQPRGGFSLRQFPAPV